MFFLVNAGGCSECPNIDTCCIMTDLVVCCPYVNGVCCTYGCCPNGYECDVNNQTCYEMPSFPLIPPSFSPTPTPPSFSPTPNNLDTIQIVLIIIIFSSFTIFIVMCIILTRRCSNKIDFSEKFAPYSDGGLSEEDFSPKRDSYHDGSDVDFSPKSDSDLRSDVDFSEKSDSDPRSDVELQEGKIEIM